MSDAATALALLTIDKYEKGVLDSITEKIPEWHWLTSKGRTVLNSHGPGYRWLARVLRGTVKGFARDTRLVPTRKNRDIQPRLTNRGYGIGEMLHQTDIWENGTPERLMDLSKDMMEGMHGDLKDVLGGGFYDDGTDATYNALGFQGANAALISSGSYAGIAKATYPRFFSAESVNGTNVVTTATGVYKQFSTNPFVAMDAAVTACRAGLSGGKSAESPDVAFLDYDLFNVVHATFLAHGQMPLNNEALKAGMSKDHFVYRGVTWFASDYVPADYLYVFNSKHIQARFPTPKVVNEYREQSGIPWAIYVLLVVYGLIAFKAPRTCGRFAVE